MTTALDPGVHVAGVTVRFGSRLALEGLDLEFGVGVHGLLGPNGAGKTTLMRVMATVLRPQAGTADLLGLNALDRRERVRVRRALGYLPQSFGYYPRFTVREFVEYFAWLKQMPRAEVPDAVAEAIERAGLTDRADSTMKSLSGGMVRRAGVAQAIVNRPTLLLLDEPTAGLDPEQRMQFRELLRRLGRDACVVVSTHLVEDVVTACTSVHIMDAGQVVYTGTPEGLIGLGAEGLGDSPIERGYTAVLQAARERRRAS